MTDWPSTLPQRFLVQGYAHQTPNNVLRTPMDQGPDKRRRISTDAVEVFSGDMRLTMAQKLIWQDFYYNTISEVGAFNFPHPDTGAPVSVSVHNNQQSAPPLAAFNANNYWTLQLALEVMP